MMNIKEEQWDSWLEILEDMLHDTDVGQASMFAIHINSAIEEAHMLRGTVRTIPKPDFLSNESSTPERSM